MAQTGRPHAQRVHESNALSDSELMERLRSHAADCRQQSMTARLTAVLPWVEQLLARGYARSQVVDLFTGLGWRFTPDSFDSALTRVRKRRVDAAAHAATVIVQAAAPAVDAGSSSAQPPSPAPSVPTIAGAPEGYAGNEMSGPTDVFLAQRDRKGQPRWK